MKVKIGFISSFANEQRIIREVAEKYADQVSISIRSGILESAVPAAKQFEREGVEVIISRGGTALMIEKMVGVPVVTSLDSLSDILQALMHAKRLGKFIGITTHKPIIEVEMLQRLLNIRIRPILFSNGNDFFYGVMEAVNEGVEVIVGKGDLTLELASQFGKKGVLITYSKEALEQTFENAIRVARHRRKELEEFKRLETVFDSLTEGVVVVDRAMQITDINTAARDILGLRDRNVLGEVVTSLFPGFPAKSVFEDRKIVESDFETVGEVLLVGTHVPILLEGKLLGAVSTFRRTSEIQRMDSRIRRKMISKGFVSRYKFDGIVAKSRRMKEVIKRAKQYALTDSTILITGETGTGKEILAQSIHSHSMRRHEPFVAINCSVIPAELLTSELFGYEEGAFSGAKKGGKQGLFELAHKGTLFLDEIATMPMDLQAKLLRVIQEREVMRLGGDRMIPVDVRIIAATNKNLAVEAQEGRFRKDLYFRLNVLAIEIPRLRDRKADIQWLAQAFIDRFCRKYGKTSPFVLDERCIRLLKEYPWPGNVRELENMMERVVLLHKDLKKVYDFLVEELERGFETIEMDRGKPQKKVFSIAQAEKKKMLKALNENSFNISQAAASIGISRATFYRKMRQYGIGR